MRPCRTIVHHLVQEIFSTLGQVGEIKIIKDKLTGLSAGYGFVQYLDHRAAEMALQSLNGRVLHGQACGPAKVRVASR
jgi:RNA recognition motif-containing protein